MGPCGAIVRKRRFILMSTSALRNKRSVNENCMKITVQRSVVPLDEPFLEGLERRDCLKNTVMVLIE